MTVCLINISLCCISSGWNGVKGLELGLVTKFIEIVQRNKESNQLDPMSQMNRSSCLITCPYKFIVNSPDSQIQKVMGHLRENTAAILLQL